MDVINESEFSIDEITKETIKCVRLGGKRTWIYLALIIISFIFCIVGLVLAKFNGKAITDFIIIGICLIIIAAILIYFIALYPKRIRSTYEKQFGSSVKFKYVFHINRFDCYADTEKQNAKSTYTYDSLIKIVETSTILRIYISKNNFLPVKKECFDQSEFEKIKKAMLNSKLKYKEKLKD